jgi:hypothetical protein
MAKFWDTWWMSTSSSIPIPAVAATLELTQVMVMDQPIGTNLGLYYGLMTLQGGHLLASRGALIPALTAAGLDRQTTKRTWQALAEGRWQGNELLTNFATQVHADTRWHPLRVGAYHVKALDTVGFFRPRLHGCQTKHYTSQAERALPAISLGLCAELGRVGDQPVAVPVQITRATGRASREEALMARLAREAAHALTEHDIVTADRKFSPLPLLHAGLTHVVLRRPKNMTMRRAVPPVYAGRGRKPKYGTVVRPLPRTHNQKTLPATPPDTKCEWIHVERGRTVQLQAQIWFNLRLPIQKRWSQAEKELARRTPWTVMVIQHPLYDTPLVVLLNLALEAAEAYQIIRGRWGIEQVPLVAKQLLGAHRQFVHALEMRFRLPELAVVAAGILTYTAACHAPLPTGWWDRRPRPTAGRLRRQLIKVDFRAQPRLGQLREKRSVTQHLPVGFNTALAQRRQC